MLEKVVGGQGLRDSLTSVMACARQSEAELGPGKSKSETEATTEASDRVERTPREAPALAQVGKSREFLGRVEEGGRNGVSVTGMAKYIGEGELGASFCFLLSPHQTLPGEGHGWCWGTSLSLAFKAGPSPASFSRTPRQGPRF